MLILTPTHSAFIRHGTLIPFYVNSNTLGRVTTDHITVSHSHETKTPPHILPSTDREFLKLLINLVEEALTAKSLLKQTPDATLESSKALAKRLYSSLLALVKKYKALTDESDNELRCYNQFHPNLTADGGRCYSKENMYYPVQYFHAHQHELLSCKSY